nr:MADF domain containing protein [Haemonchus contortus]
MTGGAPIGADDDRCPAGRFAPHRGVDRWLVCGSCIIDVVAEVFFYHPRSEMAQWTDPSRTFLIQEVRGRRVLWDTTVNDSNIKSAKAAAFAEIANVMNEAFPSSTKYTAEDIRSQWKNLKDTFVRKLRWVSEGKYTDDPLKEPTWKFYRMLSFLDDKESKRLSNDHPIFDIAALQRDHGLDLVKSELHHIQYDGSNQSAASSEEQMLSLFAQVGSYSTAEKPPTQLDSPPSPALPPVSSADTTAADNIGTKSNAAYAHSMDEEEEPRRKRAYHRRHPLTSQPQQDEFELFGAIVAAQLRRVSDEFSRAASLRLQKKLNDVIFESQMELLENGN